MELHLANTGGGPNGDEVPYTLSAGGLYWPSDNSKLSEWSYLGGWHHYPGFGSAGQFWKISSTSPRSGTYNLRWSATGSPRYVRAFGFQLCWLASTDYVPVAAKVSPDDFIKFSFWAKVSSGTPTINMRLLFTKGDVGLTSTGIVSDSETMGTSYAQHSIEAFAPADTVYLLGAEFRPLTAGVTYDVDDATLEVS